MHSQTRILFDMMSCYDLFIKSNREREREKIMKLFLFLLMLVALCSFGGVNCTDAKLTKINTKHRSGMCGKFEFGNEEAIECIMTIIDRNGDKKIMAEEINNAKTKYLAWYERVIVWLSGGPTPTIMRNCAGNDKDPITIQSFKKHRDKCLPTQNSMCHLKDMCDRAAKALGKPVY